MLKLSNNIPAIGIDSGSVAVKGAAMAGEELMTLACEPAETDPSVQCTRMIARLQSGLSSREGEVTVCVTGYGREAVGGDYATISEISANALGAGWAWRNWETMPDADGRTGVALPEQRPEKFRTIIDVGGQDSKVITFGEDGVVAGFAMNDRCAAGTGRFLQELATALELGGLQELDTIALQGGEAAPISSACTVFAESEIVSMLAKGVSLNCIAAGIFSAVADRTAELAESLQWSAPVFFDGGAAHLLALRKAFERRLGAPVAVPPRPQHITAIGAAVHAARSVLDSPNPDKPEK